MATDQGGVAGLREYAASQPRTKKNVEKQIVVFCEVPPEFDAARVARIIVHTAHERASSLSTMGVTEADTSLTEPGLDGAGTEAKSLTDASKSWP